MKFFNSSKKWRFASLSIAKYILAALLSLAGVQGVLAQYHIAGDGSAANGWTCGENWNPSGCAMSQSRNVYVYDSPELAAGTYLFRITNGTWDTTWGWSDVDSDKCTAIVADDGGDDHNVEITLNEASKVKIIFNPNAAAGHKITVYAGITPLYIRGDVNSWGDPSDWQGVSTDGINYTWEGTSLPTGNEGKTNLGGAFKIATAVNANGTWSWDDNFDFGGEESGTSIQISDTGITTATLRAKTEPGGNGNLSLSGNLQYEGAVYATKITFNISTKGLVIYTEPKQSPITPTADSYVVTWAEPVYDAEAGTVVLSATVAAAENAGFALADGTFEAQINVVGLANSARTILSETNQYTISHTISGVAANQQIDYSLQIVTGGGNPLVNTSDVQNLNPQTYTVPEAEPEPEPEPVSLYLIGAGTVAQWNLADALPFTYENGVYTWTGELAVNNEAFKILTSNTGWDPAYVAETNQFEVVLGEAIDLHYREKSGDNQYTWGDNKFKITKGGEYTIKVTLGGDNSGSMIVTKKSDPVYAATITAEALVAEQVSLASTLTETAAGTDLATATCVFQYKAADAGDEAYADMSETASVIYSDEGETRTATLIQSMAAGSYVFRAVWTYNSAEVANAVTETVTIPSDTPTPTDIEFYVRGEKIGCTPSEGGNCWGVASEEFKATSKEGNVYVWDWASEPKLMVGPFKIADAKFSDENNYGLENKTEINLTDGKWTGTLRVNTASGDMVIPEPGWNVSKITFDYDAKELLIEAETSSSCQDLANGFTISGQFNAGVTVGDGLYEGTAVESGEPDPAKGYWSDGARFIQLTANNVPANYFEWECTTYAIDGVEKTIPDIAWKDKKKTSARAELSLPGTYTFVCKARCNETDDWTISKELTITAPAPEMGFNGNIVTNHAWGTPSWAGQRDGGYMQRVEGSLVWKSNGFTVDGFGDDEEYHFVVEQRYKLLGCVTNEGWTENNECGESGESGKDNKINRSDLSFTNVAFNGNTPGHNFIAINNSGWTSGVDGTKLQLVVTMTGYDSYKVELVEYKEECQNIPTGFGISAQLNAGEAFPWVGEVVVSGSSTETGGYFADDHRTVTLSTSQVADNYEWVCVQYAIDGTLQTVNIADVVTINNSDQRSATATLNLPGDYTFQCTAACTDGTPVNSATVTISTYPEMGFDGPIGTPASVSENGWNHAWAGQSGNGLLVRENASLKWSLTFVYQGVGSTPNDFVVIQRYKRGCVTAPDGGEQGWAGFTECDAIVPGEPDFWGNKINASVIDLASGLGYASTTEGDNFRANDLAAEQGWVAGVTELTLTVTMTGWDSYTVELAKKQEQIFANYSSNAPTMGTVAMKVGDIPIDNGDDITGYIGQQVTLTAMPAPGYKVASWEINGKVTESDNTTISPTLSGAGLNVVVTFKRDCYSGIVYDLTGGGVICANGGSTELSLNTLNNVTYQLYKGSDPYGAAVEGNGEVAKWTISEAGTYTAKSYDSRFDDCKSQAIDMNGSAVVTTAPAPEITVNPGDNVHLTVLQARSFTAKVPVDWSIRSIPADTGGTYCDDDGYMISSQTDTSLVAKFLCIGTAKITATMKAPNQNCMAEVTVTQNAAETEACAPEPEDMQ